MLNTCYEIVCTVSLQFNVRKCHCLVVGKRHNFAISPMMLAGQEIKWCDHIKYLGIYLARGRVLKFDVNPLKRSFYAACNSIFSHSNGISEIALLNLQEAYSLSVLMYASPALALQSKKIKRVECMLEQRHSENCWVPAMGIC